MPVFEKILHTVKVLYPPAQFYICPDKRNNLPVIIPMKVIHFQFSPYRVNRLAVIIIVSY